MAVTLNDADPCGTARALRQAYADLVTGGATQTITHKGGKNGVEQSVTFNKADPGRLLDLVRQWEAKCEVLQGGGRPRRFAMRSGGRL
jgi:hypothetical protein